LQDCHGRAGQYPANVLFVPETFAETADQGRRIGTMISQRL